MVKETFSQTTGLRDELGLTVLGLVIISRGREGGEECGEKFEINTN